MEEARRGDVRRRALTTVEDLEVRYGFLRGAAADAGRPTPAVSTQIWYTAFGSSDGIRAAEEELCTEWAQLPAQRLDRSPYLLFGSPAQMAEALQERRERYGLERIALTGEGGIRSAPPDPVRFCREVLPLLG